MDITTYTGTEPNPEGADVKINWPQGGIDHNDKKGEGRAIFDAKVQEVARDVVSAFRMQATRFSLPIERLTPAEAARSKEKRVKQRKVIRLPRAKGKTRIPRTSQDNPNRRKNKGKP